MIKLLLLLSVGIILYATLWREKGGGGLQLRLFWTIEYAWRTHSAIYWYFIVGNIVLPFGFFFTLCFDKVKTLPTVLAGFLLSGFIELTQYVTDRGLCELDDLFHNTWGALLGCYMAVIFLGLVLKRDGKCLPQLRRAVLGVLLTIGLFVVLIGINRPGYMGI